MKISFSIRDDPKALKEARVGAFWKTMEKLEGVPELYDRIRKLPMTSGERATAMRSVSTYKARILRKSYLYGQKLKVERILDDVPLLIRECETLATA